MSLDAVTIFSLVGGASSIGGLFTILYRHGSKLSQIDQRLEDHISVQNVDMAEIKSKLPNGELRTLTVAVGKISKALGLDEP